jgi:mannan endo-1,4-beta-mannosidase
MDDHGHRPPTRAPRRAWIRVRPLTVGLVAIVLALLALQARDRGGGARLRAADGPIPPTASGYVDVGLTTLPLARNGFRPWTPADLRTIDDWEHMVHKHASVVMWYADWTSGPPTMSQLAAVARRGSVPEIAWEPWRSTHVPSPMKLQPRYRLRNIIAGRFDAYIRSWAIRLAQYGGPVRLRFAQEMNGGWYPWSERANGNRRGEFVRTWRHVYAIFRRAGATNVKWVWNPAAINMTRGQYPGDSYVSYVALTAFNGGSQLRYSKWQPFAAVIEPSLSQLRGIAPRKPVELSELGCGERGGSKSAWIRGMFSTLRRHPEITSVIWFDVVKGTDWRVGSSRSSAAAFMSGVADPRYR